MVTDYSFASYLQGSRNLVGRQNELRLLKESFYKTRMKNTILIGNAGTGKTTLIERLVLDMGNEFQFINIDLANSLSKTMYRGQFEEKWSAFLREVVKYNKQYPKKIVLFIDEIHTLYGCGGTEGAIGVSDMLKPYLSSGEITIIGATTPYEYKKTIAKDPALVRRLSPIYIKDMDKENVLNILTKFSNNTFPLDLIEYVYDNSQGLGINPDISIEIIDRCMARYKFSGDLINKDMIDNIIDYMKGDELFGQVDKENGETSQSRKIRL